jgi:hypothetical protein
MYVVRLHIPSKAASLEGAIYDTTFGSSNANSFYGQLKDICSSGVLEPFSLEYYSKDNCVYVCIAGEKATVDSVTSNIYGYLGNIEVVEVKDYTEELPPNALVASMDLYLELPDIYPLQNFKNFAWDCTTPVLTALGRVPEGDSALVQVLVRPLRDSTALHMENAFSRYFDFFSRMFRVRHWWKHHNKEETAKVMHQKLMMQMFRVNYRISSHAEIPPKATNADIRRIKARLATNLRNIANGSKSLNTTHQNRFKNGPVIFGSSARGRISQRRFVSPYKVCAIELTSMWHPPSLGTLPNTARVLSRKTPAPRALPKTPNDPQISFFGRTNYREQRHDFGIRRFDRRRHLYVVGKSGNGKSCLLHLLVKSDIDQGYGCAILDPHGDLIDDVLRIIPKHRVKDVVIFDPSDVDHPPSFNPMIPIRPEDTMRVTLSFLDTFKKVFGGSWSDKMDYVLRYAMIALLNIPGTSIVSLRRFLSDDEFRKEVVRRSPDEVVRRFWEVEFPSRRGEFDAGPVSQMLNKLDELLATDMVRNILGQPSNTFDFRDFIDSRKIVLFKISKGVLGAENASLLGSLIVWKLYEAAMSRADQAADMRQDFYFYVDEFQNFATPSFGEILSESRKYRLCLTFANQFLGQLQSGIASTVFGNIANLISFRVGSEDAAAVANELKPQIGASDLLNLGLREFYIKMSVDGEVQEAFSARTLDVERPAAHTSHAQECIEHSRKTYALPLAQAEEQLALSEILSPRAIGMR